MRKKHCIKHALIFVFLIIIQIWLFTEWNPYTYIAPKAADCQNVEFAFQSTTPLPSSRDLIIPAVPQINF